MEDVNLINCVKKYPAVYDPTTQEFKTLEEKEKAWKQIAEDLNFDLDSCKKRWRTIRERFTRELRKCYLDRCKSTFEHFELISSFLSAHIKFRSIETKGDVVVRKDPTKLYSKLIKPERDDNSSMYEPEDKEFVLSDQFYMDDPSMLENENAGDHNQSHHHQEVVYETANNPDSSDSPKHTPINHTGNTPRTPTSSNKRRAESPLSIQDETTSSFGLAIAGELAKLSRLNNIRAKVEIYKILEKYIEIEERKN